MPTTQVFFSRLKTERFYRFDLRSSQRQNDYTEIYKYGLFSPCGSLSLGDGWGTRGRPLLLLRWRLLLLRLLLYLLLWLLL